MKGQQKIYARYFSIICSFLTVLCTFFPWVYYGEEKYTIYGFYKAVCDAGGIAEFAPDGGNIYATYYISYLALLAVILMAVYGVLLIFNRKSRILYTAMYSSEFIYFTAYVIFQGYNAGPALFTTVLLVGIEFLVVLYCEQSSDINREYRMMKEREKAEKAERKRRLYFPGKYSRDFYRVIWDNFKYKWKNYVLFILSGVLSAAFLTAVIGMNYMLHEVHSVEDIVLGTGQQQILIRAIGLITFTTVFLTAYVFSYYIKSRISDYRMFTIMGIRSKTLSIMMSAEYAGSLVISFVAGMFLGTAVLVYLRSLLIKRLGEDAGVSGISPVIYLFVLAGYVFVLMLATAINYESYIQIRESFSVVQAVDSEKIPKRYLVILLLAAVNIIRESIKGYTEVSMWMTLYFLVGVFLLISRVKVLLIKWGDKSDHYYFRHLLEKIPFYYRFKKNCRYLILLTGLHLFVMGIYLIHLTSSLIAAPENELCPYDFVLMAHEEDREFLDSIQDKYGAVVNEYPMLRVTTPTGNSLDFMATLTSFSPQGQHIGISEDTYLNLNEAAGLPEPEAPGLKGNEIHIVYQQDSSFAIKPIDLTPGVGMDSPYLKTGRPDSAEEYWESDVKSREASVLTGMLQRGAQENLIVLSDDIYQKEAKLAETGSGPTKLCLINVPSENYKAVDQELSGLREKHIEDESFDFDIRVYYGKEQKVADITSERYTKQVLYAFVIVMLTACACFLAYIKFSFETEDICRRYSFYDCMGMHKKEQVKTLRKEMWPFARLPVIIGTVSAAIFTLQLFDVRMYDGAQIWDYIKTGGIIAACYLALQIIWMTWLVHQMEYKIKKNRINVGRVEEQ